MTEGQQLLDPAVIGDSFEDKVSDKFEASGDASDAVRGDSFEDDASDEFEANGDAYDALSGNVDFHEFVESSAAAAAKVAAKHPEPREIFHRATGKQFPETKEEIDFADKVLSEEFEKLSMDDRDKVLFEIHGIESAEDPEDLESYYANMERELSLIPEKEAYEAAKYFDSDYVQNMRLAFLRSERFDVKAAADIMTRHFEMKKNLFGGGEILARDIRLSDLSDDDIENVESGVLQTLQFPDAAGRAVMLVRPELEPHHEDQFKKIRAMWYIMSTTLKDEETSKKGIVLVLYANSNIFLEDIQTAQELHKVRETLPKKLVGLHLCSCNGAIRAEAAQAQMAFFNREMRLHFRPHFCESPKEIVFELQTYGIPITEDHLSSTSTLMVDWHKEWLAIRRSQEQEENSEESKSVIIPRRFDVLFGRGKNTREHSGNLRCNLLIEMHSDQYEAANKVQKTVIAERIVAMVHESLGRFLKQEKNKGWIEVTDDVAREKISHFFRFQRSKRVANAENQDENSSQSLAAKRVTPSPSPTLSSQHVSKRQYV